MSFNLPSDVGPTLNGEALVIIYLRSIWYRLIRVGEEGEGGFNHQLSNFIFFPSPLCRLLCVLATTGRTKKAFQSTGPGVRGQVSGYVGRFKYSQRVKRCKYW